MELFATIQKCLSLLPAAIRWQWVGLVPLAVLAAAMETAGAAAVFALIKIVSEPSAASTMPLAGQISELLSGRDSRGIVVSFAVLVALFYLFKNLFLAVVEFARSWITSSSQAELSRRMLQGYLTLPYVFHLRRNSAELIRNTQDSVAWVIRGAMQGAIATMTEILVVAGIVGILAFTAPLPTLGAVLLLFGLLCVFLRLTGRRAVASGRQEQELQTGSLQSLQESLGALKEVKVRGLERVFYDSFAAVQNKMMRVRHRHELFLAVPRLLIESVFVCGLLLVIGLVTAGASATHEVIPLLGLFAYGGFRIIPSVNRILWHLSQIRYASSAVEQIHRDVSLFRRFSTGEAGAPEADEIPFTNSMVLERLSYSYDGSSEPVLQDIDLTIRRGESIGIVGPTGAGKSTLINIILGLLHPAVGWILVDGRDISRHLKSWQKKIGYVPQEVYLFDTSLRRNIAFGIKNEEIDDGRVHDLLRTVQLDGFVAGLSHGLDTLVGERGVRLSGGERQRVAIARALYHDPELLVFDEATSALDNQTEREVAAAMEALHGQKTLLIIAHRMSTVRNCDRLVFLCHGRVRGCGRFEDLLRQNEEFRSMLVQDQTENSSSTVPLIR